MILNYNITTDLSVNTLMDLGKLKALEDASNIKVNDSELARRLGVDRRTVRKYINGYSKPINRKRKSQFDNYYEVVDKLLSNDVKVFHYKSILWRYLVDNHGLSAPESSFRRYISSIEKFNDYFIKRSKKGVKEPAHLRYETDAAQQAQLDWKESMELTLKSGTIVEINIFVLLLSYSRFRVYRLSLTKTQDVLFNFLNEAFETFGGVPQELLCDNMKTIMDDSRTKYKPGKVNVRFQQFADDYNIKVKPCIAYRPETKGKVESPMRILNELYAYNGDLTYDELIRKLQEINNRENGRYHENYQVVPMLALDKEKDSLQPLPGSQIRSQYRIKTLNVKVNKSSLISFENRLYSVPPKYIGKRLIIQCYDDHLHIYYNTTLVTVHKKSLSKMNYHKEHYIGIAKRTLPFDDEQIEKIAEENLRRIGGHYD